jgi:hypothetical protein
MKNALILLVVVLLPAYTVAALANEKVKYCQNLQTGDVIVVKKGYPCPYPTIEV